jgi:hypothetical protein
MIIGLMGESGAGKTSSFRNLNPDETFIIDCDKKGLSWKVALQTLKAINENEKYSGYKTVVVDTLNGIMVADEMRRSKEKGYDKWMDLASSVYELVDYALTVRSDLNVIFVCHTQTDHDDNGYMFTRIKTSGRKLDKITLESKFPVVLLAKTVDGKHVFETQANFSTAKTPIGAFEESVIENDMALVLKALEDF